MNHVGPQSCGHSSMADGGLNMPKTCSTESLTVFEVVTPKDPVVAKLMTALPQFGGGEHEPDLATGLKWCGVNRTLDGLSCPSSIICGRKTVTVHMLVEVWHIGVWIPIECIWMGGLQLSNAVIKIHHCTSAYPHL